MKNARWLTQLKRVKIRIAQVIVLLQCPVIILVAFLIGARRTLYHQKRRVCFGGCGIVNLAYWSKALESFGRDSKSIVWRTPSIYPNDTFDFDLYRRYGNFGYVMAPFHFLLTISKNEIIVCGFDGFILGMTLLKKIEPLVIHLAKCKLIAIPYGGDAYVYSSIKNESLIHAIQVSYPDASRKQIEKQKNVNRMVRHADFVIPGIMGFDGIGRWDVLAVSSLAINTELWQSLNEQHHSRKLRVIHTPNHRGFKGTEFLIAAVNELQSEGVSIELQLIENRPNSEVREILAKHCDVLVEQLVCPGYGMSAVEGLSSGVVVVSNLGDERIMVPFRRWSFLSECPIISASPETIKEILRNLSKDREFRQRASVASREYAQKYHSYDAFYELYSQIEKYLFGEREDLYNYYHPLLGEFGNAKKKIQVQLLIRNDDCE
jgi:hypothetical protein